METEQVSDLGIVVPRKRKKTLLAMGILFSPLLFLFMIFMLIALILHDVIDGIVALSFLLEIAGILWFLRRARRLFFSDIPPLRINQQGIIFIDSYRLSFKITLIPWSEIAKLSCFHTKSPIFTITLKNPQYWWSYSGNERPRTFPLNSQFGGAQFAFAQGFLSTSLPELFQQIQVNYAHEIQINEVEIASR